MVFPHVTLVAFYMIGLNGGRKDDPTTCIRDTRLGVYRLNVWRRRLCHPHFHFLPLHRLYLNTVAVYMSVFKARVHGHMSNKWRVITTDENI